MRKLLKDSARKAMYAKNIVFVHANHRGQDIKLLGDVDSNFWHQGIKGKSHVSWNSLNNNNSKNFRVMVDGNSVFKSDNKEKAYTAINKIKKQ